MRSPKKIYNKFSTFYTSRRDGDGGGGKTNDNDKNWMKTKTKAIEKWTTLEMALELSILFHFHLENLPKRIYMSRYIVWHRCWPRLNISIFEQKKNRLIADRLLTDGGPAIYFYYNFQLWDISVSVLPAFSTWEPRTFLHSLPFFIPHSIYCLATDGPELAHKSAKDNAPICTQSLFIIQWDFHILRRQNFTRCANIVLFAFWHKCKHIYLAVYRTKDDKLLCLRWEQGAFNLQFMQIVFYYNFHSIGLNPML